MCTSRLTFLVFENFLKCRMFCLIGFCKIMLLFVVVGQ
uniref:Uncharacterized protein n=1 Tax=Heterorhabditis bacteriophora TaxID=37862 RepID=A0A1I7WTT8_HETBA